MNENSASAYADRAAGLTASAVPASRSSIPGAAGFKPPCEDGDGPLAMAWRMASYIKDAAYIHGYVKREYGVRKLPTPEMIRQFQAEHARRKAIAAIGVADTANDNGEPWRPASLVKAPRPYVRRGPMPPPSFEIGPLTAIDPHKPYQWRAVALVASAYGITPADITGHSRKRRLMCARAIVIQLLRNRRRKSGAHSWSLTKIGQFMGGRDHSSICNALKVFPAYRRMYPEMKAVYNLARRKLG